MEKKELSIELLQTIVNYLSTRPYQEVFGLIANIVKEVNLSSQEKGESSLEYSKKK